MVAVLATSAAYATYHIPAGVVSPLLMVLAAIAYFAVSSLALAWFAARAERKSTAVPAAFGNNLFFGPFRIM